MENPIKNFEELLQPYLQENVTISGSTVKRLTAAGDNYGSQMLAVDVTVQNKKINKKEILYLVAKMCPPNEWLQKMFNTAVSFKKEIAIYTTIIPTLRAFQKEQGISNVTDFFPECFGARVSLNHESNMVDNDAVLLLENLKQSGFVVADRMKGFDLETTEFILKDLAVFHAVPIALKLLKPKLFKEKILPHLDANRVFSAMSDGAKKSVIDFIVESAKGKPECLPFIKKIEESLTTNLENMCNPLPPKEPFATINHNDYWVNNTMILFENNKPVKNKMVDFQLIDYGSPGKDIVFLLFGSIQKEVLEKHYDNFLKLYYNTFIKTLKELKCDTKPFTFELLLEEINESAKTMEFFHVMIMLKHILATKGKVKDVCEMTEEDMLSQVQVSNEFIQRAPEVVFEFIQRKWI